MRLVARIYLAASAAAIGFAAQAAPVPSGLSINVVRVGYEIDPVLGTAIKNTTGFGTFGGVGSSAPSGSFTQTGDRIGATMTALGNQPSSTGPGAVVPLFASVYALTFTNNTATAFEVVLTALANNSVNATGLNAYAYSQFVVERGNTPLFFSDYEIDTDLDDRNRRDVSTSNLITLTLDPNSTLVLSADQEIEAGLVGIGSFSASLEAALELTSIRQLGGVDPDPGDGGTVPLPGTLTLLLAALPGLVLARRRA